MTDPQWVPEASVYRLSLYHCYLGERLRSGHTPRVTSRQLAQDLGVKDETVRRDLSFMGGIGRPGAGYDAADLFHALQSFLGLRDDYPIANVGSVQMLEALSVVFPAESYGVRPAAYFSEVSEDAGRSIHGITVLGLADIPLALKGSDITVALVACSPGRVQPVIDLLGEAGIVGVLLLTPALSVAAPAGMNVTQIRMPCDIKSLACRCRIPARTALEGA